jgi:hypothetical protein
MIGSIKSISMHGAEENACGDYGEARRGSSEYEMAAVFIFFLML